MKLIYNLLNLIILPIYIIIFLYRLILKKENFSRISERFGIASQSRPKGKLVWVHGASIGESVMALSLINNLHNSHIDITFLLTTGTTSSSKIIEKNLSSHLIHQFLPLDFLPCVKNFLGHWKPDLSIILESEIWPNVIYESSRNSTLLLVNGIISDKSFQVWKKFRFFLKDILKNYDMIATQSQEDYDKFKYFNDNINLTNVGNLKFSNAKLSFNLTQAKKYKQALKGYKVVIAVSTHDLDEINFLQHIQELKSQFKLCVILIPRHLNRNQEIQNLCNQLGLSYSFRSQNENIDLNKDIYVADTHGELGLFYELADISFIGGSFKDGIHNPLEPIMFSNLIMFGPENNRIRPTVNQMLKADAAIEVQNSYELFEQLKHVLSSEEVLEKYQQNALKIGLQNQHILQDYLSLINNYLDKIE